MSSIKWDENQIPPQHGRVVIVTGSSSGIGFEAARMLAEKGATVILAARNRRKLDAALRKIEAEIPDAKVESMTLDLADLSAVQRFAEDFRKKYQQLDLLINNAGVMVPPYSKTADGFELQFGTNHLGHFALTALLFPMLKSTAGARVVNVSSSAHNFGNLNFDDLNWEKRRYQKWRAYGDSKIANLYFTYELGRRGAAAGLELKVTAAHPGWSATELQRHTGPTRLLNALFAQSAKMGALPTLRAAIDPAAQSGDFFGPSGFMEMRGYPVKTQPKRLAKDPVIAARLWEESEKMTGIRFDM